MIAIITGAIVSDHLDSTQDWLSILKELLRKFGDSPQTWQIFRGNQFQLKVEVKDALFAALILQSGIRKMKGFEVSLAVGIGNDRGDSDKIAEAKGAAYRYSEKLFDTDTKKKLQIKSTWEDFDEEINLYVELALLIIERWTPSMAELVWVSLEFPKATQTDLGRLLKKSQPAVSDGLARAGYDTILKMERRYRRMISQRM